MKYLLLNTIAYLLAFIAIFVLLGMALWIVLMEYRDYLERLMGIET